MKYNVNFTPPEEAACIMDAYAAQFQGRKPLFGLTLGSGLGTLAEEIKDQIIIDYKESVTYPIFRSTK